MSNVKIFTSNIEEEAVNQINTLVNIPVFSEAKVRIMPDVHAGAGCVIGFTANLGDKVIPNIVGVDIGCGMLAVELGNIDIDLERLDRVIHQVVPAGMNVHKITTCHFPLEGLKCYSAIANKNEYFQQSIGTLGGGNHFVELDTDASGNKYLIIHTGSRNLGCQVAKYYQELAIIERSGRFNEKEEIAETIKSLKAAGKEREISTSIANIKAKYARLEPNIPNELCYLTGVNREAYLHDMAICQEYAEFNRRVIAQNILSTYFQDHVRLNNEENRGDWCTCDVVQYEFYYFETVHNYISFEDNIVRKGAIYAGLGKKVLIPLNMRDGCIIGIGKGNEDWNCSAPHGAGRVMSRSKARETVNMEEYQASMKGIYTTTVSELTIDEAPMVYKPAEEIIENIQETVEVINHIYPVYNFKAEE